MSVYLYCTSNRIASNVHSLSLRYWWTEAKILRVKVLHLTWKSYPWSNWKPSKCGFIEECWGPLRWIVTNEEVICKMKKDREVLTTIKRRKTSYLTTSSETTNVLYFNYLINDRKKDRGQIRQRRKEAILTTESKVMVFHLYQRL